MAVLRFAVEAIGLIREVVPQAFGSDAESDVIGEDGHPGLEFVGSPSDVSLLATESVEPSGYRDLLLAGLRATHGSIRAGKSTLIGHPGHKFHQAFWGGANGSYGRGDLVAVFYNDDRTPKVEVHFRYLQIEAGTGSRMVYVIREIKEAGWGS